MLWTDIIDPATLTGYARASLEDYELTNGTLARWLPHRTVADIVARFVKGDQGLVNVSQFRAYDAEPEFGRRKPRERVILELPALGEQRPVTEYEQLRARGGELSAEEALVSIQNETSQAVRAAADAMERMRGIVIDTGIATIDQPNFQTADDFGRDPTHSVTATTLWSAVSPDPLTDLQAWSDVYEASNGGTLPGSIVMSRRVFRAMSNAPQFRTTLIGGAERAANQAQVNDMIVAAGLPPIVVYDRRVSVADVLTRVLPDDALYLLPAEVGISDWQGTDLGATFNGRTLTSMDSSYNIQPAEQPGIVAGVYRNEKPPMGIETVTDAIGLPVLANANRSFKAVVL